MVYIKPREKHHLDSWRWRSRGKAAVNIYFKIYNYLSDRRKRKIDEVLKKYCEDANAREKYKKLNGVLKMWLSAIKVAVQAGSKIYANRQKAKMAMSEAQLLHAERQARGEEAYQGKLLEARQSDWKDEFVLLILSAPIAVLAWAVISDDPSAMDKVKIFFDHFQSLPSWFTNLWILVVASIFGIKGTQIFRNGKK